MRTIDLNIRGMELNFQHAGALAGKLAAQLEEHPELIAWHDGPHAAMSPVIEGADRSYRWRDYGVSHGGDVLVSVNGDYDFIFTEAGGFEGTVPSPYIAVRDQAGRNYLCLPKHLKEVGPAELRPEEGCVPLEQAGALSGLHEG